MNQLHFYIFDGYGQNEQWRGHTTEIASYMYNYLCPNFS